MQLFTHIIVYFVITNICILKTDSFFGGSVGLATICIIPATTSIHILMAFIDYYFKKTRKLSYLIYMSNTIGAIIIMMLLFFFDGVAGVD